MVSLRDEGLIRRTPLLLLFCALFVMCWAYVEGLHLWRKVKRAG